MARALCEDARVAKRDIVALGQRVAADDAHERGVDARAKRPFARSADLAANQKPRQPVGDVVGGERAAHRERPRAEQVVRERTLAEAPRDPL